MSEVQSVASLHEDTVIRAEEHAEANERQKVRAAPTMRARTDRVLKVHPEVMRVAKELADGDVRRIEIIDAKTVMVR